MNQIEPAFETVPVPDARRRRLITSLQQRFRLAEERRDSRAKQELFREAIISVYSRGCSPTAVDLRPAAVQDSLGLGRFPG